MNNKPVARMDGEGGFYHNDGYECLPNLKEKEMAKIQLQPIKNPTETIELTPSNTITFNILSEPVLLLDKDGFTYLGQRITDAGKAYDIWMEVMLKMKALEK